MKVKKSRKSFFQTVTREYSQNRQKIRASLPENCPCPYCNVVMLKNAVNHPASITIDHIKPRSKGGSDQIENLIAVCKNCNEMKSSLNEVNLFRLNQATELRFNDFAILNSYVKFFNRYTVLNEIQTLLKKEDLLAVVDLINSTVKTNNSATYFKMILKMIRTNVNKSVNLKKNLKTCNDWIKNAMACEKKHLEKHHSQVQHIDFAVYSVMTTQINENRLAA